MALPLALALFGAGLGGREWMQGREREQQADAFGGMLGQYSIPGGPLMGTEGQEFAGPVQPQAPGSGLRGAFQGDPQSEAMLEALGKFSGMRDVRPQDLMLGLGGLLSRQGGQQSQAASIQAAREAMQSQQDFQREQFGNEWAQRFLMENLNQAPQWARLAFDQATAGAGGARLGSNMMMYPTPSGGAIPGPVPGTSEYANGQNAIIGGRQFLDVVDRLQESYLLGGRGREYRGFAAGEQASLYGQIRGMVAKAEGSGVLQEGEYKRFLDTYPSPQAFFNKLWTGDEYTLGTVAGWRRQAVDTYDKARGAYPWAQAPDAGAAPTPESVAARYAGTPVGDDVRGRLVPLGQGAAPARQPRRVFAGPGGEEGAATGFVPR